MPSCSTAAAPCIRFFLSLSKVALVLFNTMSKEFTIEELSNHNTKKELFVAIRGYVYDVTGFLEDHPYVSCFPVAQVWRFHTVNTL